MLVHVVAKIIEQILIYIWNQNAGMLVHVVAKFLEQIPSYIWNQNAGMLVHVVAEILEQILSHSKDLSLLFVHFNHFQCSSVQSFS